MNSPVSARSDSRPVRRYCAAHSGIYCLMLSLAAPFLGSTTYAGDKALIDTTKSPDAKMYMVNLADVRWTEGFWAERFEACRTTMIPNMWEIFQSEKDSHAWANFLIAAGLYKGDDPHHHGPPFNDGDFLKWVEAVAQMYAVTKDPALDQLLDHIIEVVGKAQREDGYLHTMKVIPQRQGDKTAKEFENRDHFETYNMGHLMTAACIHYRVTGKPSMLVLARKSADYLYEIYKRAPDELARNAICPSHYMGVVELYRTTREPRYLELAKGLVEIRDLVKNGDDQNQDRQPFRQAMEAVGHAVRANYLYAGVADVVAETGDASLMKPLNAIAADVASQKLYVTGMTGAVYDGASPDGTTKHESIGLVHQAYGRDYELPNLTAYNETCATIGYALWTWRMLELTGDAHYTDLFEQSLYNGVLPGISLEGKNYFYVNPLRKSADFKWPMRWERTRMPNIKSSFCCPPNVVRTIAEAHNYVYSLSEDTLWVNLYGASTLDTAWTDGSRIKLRQDTNYPWDGVIKLTMSEVPDRPVKLKLRIPGWMHADASTLRVNGKAVDATLKPGTYAEVKRTWKPGDVVELSLNFQPVVLEANPLVEETVNQVSVKYGPLVYCLEANDLPKGVRLSDVVLSSDPKKLHFKTEREEIVNAHVVALNVSAEQLQHPAWKSDQLYREVGSSSTKEINVKLVPYFAWGNRGDTDMSVWIPTR